MRKMLRRHLMSVLMLTLELIRLPRELMDFNSIIKQLAKHQQQLLGLDKSCKKLSILSKAPLINTFGRS